MTEAEKNEIVQSVLEAIQTNSKTIDQLTAIEELKDGDYMEVNGGRRIAYKTLCNLVASMAREELEAFKQLAETRLSELSTKNTQQDTSISYLTTLIEQVNETAETAGATAQANASSINSLQTSVSSNASDIDNLQRSVVSHGNSIELIETQLTELSTKNAQQDTSISANNEYIATVEQNCNSRQDVFDTQIAEIKSRLDALEQNS